MVNNKSRTFLLPLLSELVGFEKRFHKNIVNTYTEFSCGNYDNCIGVVQDFSFKNPDYTSYEHRFIKNSLFRELKDIEDNQVLYIFDFPEEYLHEYNCYKKGQYSKFERNRYFCGDLHRNCCFNFRPSLVIVMIRTRSSCSMFCAQVASGSLALM